MSKIDLPPLPKGVSPDQGIGKAMLAYAEQAVRVALAAQEPVAWMTEDGRVSTDATKQTAMPKPSKLAFCIPLAIIPESSHE